MRKINISDEQLKRILKNAREAPKNHYVADCPFCHKEQHFYINRKTKRGDCKKCKEVVNNLYKLLKQLDAFDLSYYDIHVNEIPELEEGINLFEYTKNPKYELPLIYKRQYFINYLSSERNFKEVDYERYEVGTSLLHKDRIYFIIREDGQCVGYISRSIKSKQWIDQYNETAVKKYLRYENCGAELSNMLYGYDEIIPEITHTVILTEGFFNKKACDDFLNLWEQDEIKACACFGKKVSMKQILKLLMKGVSKVILAFDFDAVEEIKKYCYLLFIYFDVEILVMPDKKDLDECNKKELMRVFSNPYSPSQYNSSIIPML